MAKNATKYYGYTGESKVVTIRGVTATVKRIYRESDGEVGGWIESDNNIACGGWVADEAIVIGNGRVINNGLASGNAVVMHNSTISNRAVITGNAVIDGNRAYGRGASICNGAIVSGNAVISGDGLVIDDGTIVTDNVRVDRHGIVSDGAIARGDLYISSMTHMTPEYTLDLLTDF